MFFWKKLKFGTSGKHSSFHQEKNNASSTSPESSVSADGENVTGISPNVNETAQYLEKLLGHNEDFKLRYFDALGQYKAIMVYLSSMIEPGMVNSDILKPLMHPPERFVGKSMEPEELKQTLLHDTLYHCKGELAGEMDKLVESILRGYTLVFIEGLNEGFVLPSCNIATRSITQPETEQVIRGPREGFIENLETNIALMRYRLPTADFRIKSMKIGKITRSKVAVCYLEGIVNPALVEEVIRRLSNIDIDGVMDSGYLEQFIEDNHYSPFPQIQNSERPDKAVASMLEGRVIILVDGSPFALIAPSVFNQFYQTTEDYSERFVMVSFIRLARLLALAFSLITPSLYVAIISYNPELIPTEFAVAVAGGRAGVPFPSVVEVLLMEVSMEVLREATLRLPQQIGGALSIVGVLVVGTAAVAAGFVSPITVVVIALTTIGSFATPAYNAALALRLLRFPLVFIAGMFGLYGVMAGLILIANHMLSLRSFGVPYLSPVISGNFQGFKDTVIRAPLSSMRKRPAMLHTLDSQRIGSQVAEKQAQPTHNTLDPLKVGNEKWGEQHGVSTSGDDDTSNGRSD